MKPSAFQVAYDDRIGKCSFKKGSTTHENERHAPEKCKAAFAKRGVLIEICPVSEKGNCPVGKFHKEGN